jgi:hypothetical protein
MAKQPPRRESSINFETLVSLSSKHVAEVKNLGFYYRRLQEYSVYFGGRIVVNEKYNENFVSGPAKQLDKNLKKKGGCLVLQNPIRIGDRVEYCFHGSIHRNHTKSFSLFDSGILVNEILSILGCESMRFGVWCITRSYEVFVDFGGEKKWVPEDKWLFEQITPS